MAIYHAVNCKISVKNIELGLISVDGSIEMCGAMLTCGGEVFIIVCIYRPPHRQRGQLDTFFEQLKGSLDKIERSFPNAKIIITGDLNICQISESANRSALSELIALHGMHSAITKPTRVTHVSATSLDVFLTNLGREKYTTEVIHTTISDHYGIVMNIVIQFRPSEGNTSHYELKRSKRNADHETFQQYLSDATWDDVLKTRDPDLAYSNFARKIESYFELSFPFKLSKIKGWQPPKVELGNHLTNLKEEVSILSEIYNRTGDEYDKAIFSAANERYKRCLNQQKGLTYKNFIDQSANRQRACWRLLNYERGKSAQVPTPVTLSNKPELSQVASTFNEYFIS